MKLRKVIVLFLLVVSVFISAYGQLTIGSTDSPVSGAILELKETGTTTKGLGLPRVQLTSLAIPSGETSLATTIDGATGTWDAVKHVGLVVYNMNKCVLGSTAGIHVWDGSAWIPLIPLERSPEVYEVPDNRDPSNPDVYLARKFGAAGHWMLENMRYIDPMMTAKAGDGSNNVTDKYYTYPGGDAANPDVAPSTWRKQFGLFYSFSAATLGQQDSESRLQGQGDADQATLDGNTNSIQGICPPDWHIPSDAEWNELEKELYNSANLYSQFSSSDLPFQAVYAAPLSTTLYGWDDRWEGNGTTNENNPNSGIIAPAGYRGSTDTSKGHGLAIRSECPPTGSTLGVTNGRSLSSEEGGFDAYLTGLAFGGSIYNYGGYSGFWTASANGTTRAWCRVLQRTSQSVVRYLNLRHYMYSVRCKKNE